MLFRNLKGILGRCDLFKNLLLKYCQILGVVSESAQPLTMSQRCAVATVWLHFRTAWCSWRHSVYCTQVQFWQLSAMQWCHLLGKSDCNQDTLSTFESVHQIFAKIWWAYFKPHQIGQFLHLCWQFDHTRCKVHSRCTEAIFFFQCSGQNIPLKMDDPFM